MDFMNHPDPFVCDLLAAYHELCLLLSKLDKHILADRYIIHDSDPVAVLRSELKHWVNAYDLGKPVTYVSYIWLSNAARDVLEGAIE